jgi:hypothetical protein
MTQHSPDLRPLNPSDLDTLERVLDAVCKRRGIDKSDLDAEYIAAELVQYYTQGVRQEVELKALVS